MKRSIEPMSRNGRDHLLISVFHILSVNQPVLFRDGVFAHIQQSTGRNLLLVAATAEGMGYA